MCTLFLNELFFQLHVINVIIFFVLFLDCLSHVCINAIDFKNIDLVSNTLMNSCIEF